MMTDTEVTLEAEVAEAIAALQDGKVVTIHNAAVVNALTSQLVREAAVLKLAVKARWNKGYTFEPLVIGEGVTPGVQ